MIVNKSWNVIRHKDTSNAFIQHTHWYLMYLRHNHNAWTARKYVFKGHIIAYNELINAWNMCRISSSREKRLIVQSHWQFHIMSTRKCRGMWLKTVLNVVRVCSCVCCAVFWASCLGTVLKQFWSCFRGIRPRPMREKSRHDSSPGPPPHL